jgi:hypothetical protein
MLSVPELSPDIDSEGDASVSVGLSIEEAERAEDIPRRR